MPPKFHADVAIHVLRSAGIVVAAGVPADAVIEAAGQDAGDFQPVEVAA